MPLFSDTEFSDISARPCLTCAGFSRLGNDTKNPYRQFLLTTWISFYKVYSILLQCRANISYALCNPFHIGTMSAS